uniref:Putative purple acid phosphatase 14 n=1 Tax=Helianthus annuus TaxID=4232 RepID=A0A251T724_HELAN
MQLISEIQTKHNCVTITLTAGALTLRRSPITISAGTLISVYLEIIYHHPGVKKVQFCSTMGRLPMIIVVFISSFSLLISVNASDGIRQLRFDKNKGEFKILQVADMHYANGKKTKCRDVLPKQVAHCSDLNTTYFIERMIQAEKPDLIVFTGDNIYGTDTTDPVASMNAAFAPAVSSNIPWAAVLGNHDQESTLSREGLMKHIVGMNHTLSQLNPFGVDVIDGFGNYNLEVHGTEGSSSGNESILNLYFLDSGDYSTVPAIPGYGWIKPSQQFWFQQTSMKLQRKSKAPGLAYFHIPLPEYSSFDSSSYTGVELEPGNPPISSASVNSGFFTTLVGAGDVKAVFVGHDHLNDFCGELTGINLCYAGGFGYHAYGKAGWSRRSRVVVASLEKKSNGSWGAVEFIKTYKRLDDGNLTVIDDQVLWTKTPSGNGR